MQPQPQFSPEQVCSQCGSPMPREMRFCRSCGNRLGEGPAEYTETVLLPGAAPRPSAGTTPFYPSVNAPLIRPVAPQRRKVLGLYGMTWFWIVLAVFLVGGGLMSAVRKNIRERVSISINENRSFFGVSDFDNTDGGVTFKSIEAPGTPADRAGLVGGDIITSFDGRQITRRNDLMDALGKTDIGKTVEVVYLRDGISRTTQLTTISRDQYRRLEDEYNGRPEGKGYFGFESNRMTRIDQPDTKTFGVQIDYVEANGPAELFGIRKGDIITDFDKVPIRTSQEFLARVKRAYPFTMVEITVLREGQKMVIPVKIGKAR